MAAQVLSGRQIAVGVGGGIAAYKACDLVRQLRHAGAEVRVAMTEAAQQFVSALTFQALSGHPVLTNAFDPTQEAGFGHLGHARWAELFIVAPATADLIARIRAGMANDAVTSSLLAFRGPVILAPAMNVAMWESSLTQENLNALLREKRFSCVGPGVGLLADGDVGAGRLAEVSEIVAAAGASLAAGDLAGKQVLVTAGPTREFVDPVRFLSNPSTGKMGLAIARAARNRGAQVTVVLGPVGPVDRSGLTIVDVVSAEDMAREVLSRIEACDYFVAAAAVSDYRPESRAPQKLKKSDAPESLRLLRTPDVLLEAAGKVRSAGRPTVLVGFAAETERVLEHARAKLEGKQLDFIVANDVSQPDAGFASDFNHVSVLARGGQVRELAGSKADVARQLWDLLVRSAA